MVYYVVRSRRCVQQRCWPQPSVCLIEGCASVCRPGSVVIVRKPAAVSLPVIQGLLAGRNDYQLLKHGGIRDINRHTYR